eukprot:scaffold1211_cov169-Amphora_coffeaeformis.AAC.14
MRYDLAFFLCCCKSFIGDSPDGEEDYYQLLGIERDATADEIKRAYKRQSLQMHPDKLAQRGQTVTEGDQAKFTRMKEAYEVLADPHKRETYDAVGERGMKWIDEPFSIDPQELAHNFATSSTLDRAKIFSIFVFMAVAVLLLPMLVCLHEDGVFGEDASWFATLTPLWLWDVFILFYHTRVIMMGPIARPEHISPEEWVDPLPMKKRIFSLLRFVLIVAFEVLLALKVDGILDIPWAIIFIPLYVWELTTLYKKWPLAKMRIVTVEDLEAALGKPFSEFSPAEKDLIAKRYSVVPSVSSPEFDAAQKLKTRARHDIIKSIFRVAFVLLLLCQLDRDTSWNWWLVFTPFWIMSLLICYANYQSFAEVQQKAMKKDPSLFGLKATDVEQGGTAYGAMGNDGTVGAQPQISEEEREELKAQMMASSSRLCSKCCSQGFLLFVVVLFVAKLDGGGFSSIWIISPFLFVAGIILLCLGCAIFGVTEVPTDGVEFDTATYGYSGPTAQSATTTNTPEAAPAPNRTEPTQPGDPPIITPMPPNEPQMATYAPPSSGAAPTNAISVTQGPVIVPPAVQQPVDLLDNVQSSNSKDGMTGLD